MVNLLLFLFCFVFCCCYVCFCCSCCFVAVLSLLWLLLSGYYSCFLLFSVVFLVLTGKSYLLCILLLLCCYVAWVKSKGADAFPNVNNCAALLFVFRGV